MEEVGGSMWEQQKYLLKFSLNTKCFYSTLCYGRFVCTGIFNEAHSQIQLGTFFANFSL